MRGLTGSGAAQRGPADLVELLLQLEPIERGKGQGREDLDAVLELAQGGTGGGMSADFRERRSVACA
jgi:hypothetical protein